MSLFPSVKNGDWTQNRKNWQKLGTITLGLIAEPTFANLTLTGLTASQLIQTDASKKLVSIALPLIVAKGGTGAATLTDHGILLGSGTGAITPLGVATNGQLPIGSTGADPVLAGITGTANQITVTNGAGSITLSLPTDVIISGTSTPSITIESTDASDPTLIFKTTNTTNQINMYLDESGTPDNLRIAGQTASQDTQVIIQAQDGERSRILLYSGTSNYGYLHYGAADTLTLANTKEDEDIVLSLNDGGATKTITWDADVDKLKHSAGAFDFDNDNIVTTGIINASAGEVRVEDKDTTEPTGESDGYVGVAVVGGNPRIYFAVSGSTYYVDGTPVPASGSSMGLLLALTYP